MGATLAEGGPEARAQAPVVDPAELAPGPKLLAQRAAELERAVARAEASAQALRRLHNAAALELEAGRAACEAPVFIDRLARATAMGPPHRDLAQAALVAAARWDRVARSPTLAPLAAGPPPPARAAADALVRDAAELQAWDAALLAPWRARCPARVVPAAGLPGPAGGLTAVLGVGPGVLCPSGDPLEGHHLVAGGRACAQPAGPCACAPAEVLPGAAIAAGGGPVSAPATPAAR
jgi:hypothetical protein